MSRQIFEQPDTAGQALRENLHHNDLGPTARKQMERALAHVREACIATNEIGKARSVQQLVRELEQVERLVEKIRDRRQPAVIAIKPIRV